MALFLFFKGILFLFLLYCSLGEKRLLFCAYRRYLMEFYKIIKTVERARLKKNIYIRFDGCVTHSSVIGTMFFPFYRLSYPSNFIENIYTYGSHANRRFRGIVFAEKIIILTLPCFHDIHRRNSPEKKCKRKKY